MWSKASTGPDAVAVSRCVATPPGDWARSQKDGLAVWRARPVSNWQPLLLRCEHRRHYSPNVPPRDSFPQQEGVVPCVNFPSHSSLNRSRSRMGTFHVLLHFLPSVSYSRHSTCSEGPRRNPCCSRSCVAPWRLAHRETRVTHFNVGRPGRGWPIGSRARPQAALWALPLAAPFVTRIKNACRVCNVRAQSGRVCA